MNSLSEQRAHCRVATRSRRRGPIAVRRGSKRRTPALCVGDALSHPSAEGVAAEPGVRYSRAMAPTVLRDGAYRLFFFSREEPRIHVHVAHPDGEAKFWLLPNIALAASLGLSDRQIREAQAIVETHLQEILDAWYRHFGS